MRTQDVAWHCTQDSIFGSVGDDKLLLMSVSSCLVSLPDTNCFDMGRWDTRGQSGAMKPIARVEAHSAEVNSLAFSPANENILITGSADKVRLFKSLSSDP